MKRRDLALGAGCAALSALAGAASSVAPFAAWARSERVYRIGFICSECSPEDVERFKAGNALVKPLAALGYVVGKNLRFEGRSVPHHFDDAKGKAATEDLVRAQVDVLIAMTDLRCAPLAAATSKTPIVCQSRDPVGLGFAQSLRRPGRNITGISAGIAEGADLAMELARAIFPRVKREVSVVPIPPGSNAADSIKFWSTVRRARTLAVQARGIETTWAPVATLADVEKVFKGLGDPATAVVNVQVPEDVDDKAVWALAIRHRIATVAFPGDVRNGALMSHGRVHSDAAGRMAALIDRIFRGENPAEIPFELPDRTFFVVNRSTAKAMGARLTPEVLVRATEVVE